MTRSTSTFSRLVRLALVGGIPLLLALLFLWAGGWLTPQRLSADKLVNTLQAAPGTEPGFRRNHAKGVCVIGEFTSNGSASTLFGRVKTPVTGRFALAGGNPHAPDLAVPIRSMALAFTTPSGQQWQPVSAGQKGDKDFLQRDLTRRLAEGPLKWDLFITLAGKGDAGNDASKAWPADRQTVNAGTLELTRAVPQEGGPCNNINYDPLILPDGIAASDDPLLNARSAAYAKSYNRRTVEEAHGAAGEHL